MRYDQSPRYRDEIENMEAVLTLLNLRDAAIQGCLQTRFECCSWFDEECRISLKDADFLQLSRFLLYLHKPMEEGGRGLRPGSVNAYNSFIMKYFFYVLRNPISNTELPYRNTVPAHPFGVRGTSLLMYGTKECRAAGREKARSFLFCRKNRMPQENCQLLCSG